VLHTGMDGIRPGYTRGIHWHIQNEVRFVSPDPQRREIPWVEVIKPDGSKVVYTDAETKLSAQQIAALPARPDGLLRLPQRGGPPLHQPGGDVDEAIRTGKIDRKMPDTKARAVALMDKLTEITGETKDRAPRWTSCWRSHGQGRHAGRVQARRAEVQHRDAGHPDGGVVPREGLSWKSFPNHTGHADYGNGCFRCHDGKHFNDKGEAIRLQCTLCHALPEVVRENGKGTVPSLLPEKAGEKQPDSHKRPNFMHTHADDVAPECEECHGTRSSVASKAATSAPTRPATAANGPA
jgi:hypothetical protein